LHQWPSLDKVKSCDTKISTLSYSKVKDRIIAVSICLSDGSSSQVYGQPSKVQSETVEWKMPRDTEIRRVSVKSFEGKILALMFCSDEAG
jgi:hypothetical protein